MSTAVKTCRFCLQELPLDCFPKGNYRNGSERIRNECKICKRSIEKERRSNNREKFIARDKKYYENNKEVILEKNRERYYRNSHKYKQNKEDRAEQVPKPCKSDSQGLEEPAPKQSKNDSQDLQEPTPKPRRSASYRITSAAKARALHNLKGLKCFQVFELMACSKKELIKWLSYQLNGDQTLENFGSVWHMDHVIPVSFFDLSDWREVEMCFHWSNIRPLNSKDNHKKASKIIKTDILTHIQVIKRFCQDNSGYQTNIEKCWWPRVELGYGKNPKDEEDFASFLKWTIRS